MVRGDGNVVGLDSDPVQRLHPQHVAVGVGVGEDAGVGDPEPLQVIGNLGGRRRLQRQVDVDGVEVPAVEEVVALGGDRLLEVGARLADGDQRQVVVLLDLDMQIGSGRQLELRPAARRGCPAACRARSSGRRSRGGARARRRGGRDRRSASCRRAPPTGAGRRAASAASLATEAGIQPSRKPVSCAPSSMLALWL